MSVDNKEIKNIVELYTSINIVFYPETFLPPKRLRVRGVDVNNLRLEDKHCANTQ